jgi:hypothetical protein
MDASLKASIQSYVTQYDNSITIDDLTIDLAYRMFKDIRKYPSEYTDTMILADSLEHSSEIAMAVVEIASKYGIENQRKHSENGFTRDYFESIHAYSGVKSIVNIC